MRTGAFTRLSLLTAMLALATPATARPPTLVYEGTLENAAGEPVTCSDATNCPEGLLSFTFRLYRDDTDTLPLWSEQHENVPVVRGVFRVELGSVSGLDETAVVAARTVGVAVNNGDELSPRQRLVSVPFSVAAGRAEQATQAARADSSSRADDASALGGIPAGDFTTVDDVLDLCLTPEALATSLLAGGYVTEAALPGLLAGLGVSTGPGFSGRFGDLSDVPDGLADGDDDTLAALTCTEGEVAVFHALDGAWHCELPSSGLSEAEVDALVANNGFAQDVALATVAKSGRFADLLDVPAALTDGDDDTLATLTLTCFDGQVAKRFGTVWVCDDDATLSEADVDAMVSNNGFARAADLAAVATTGRFGSLQDVPNGLNDGDDDTLGALTCLDGQVAKRQGNAWVCGTDIDTKLTEAEVDAFADNNGYALDADLSDVARSGSFADLLDVPAAIADGDADTLGALTCVDGQVAKRLGNAWVCGNDIDTKLTEAEVDAFVANNGFAASSSLATVATSGRFSDLSGVPSGLGDGDNDTLGALTCVDGQVAKRQGNTWVCETDIDTKLTEAEVDAFADNNGYALDADLSDVARSGSFADLLDVPAAIADGDADTLGALTCVDGQLAKRQGNAWVCGNDIDTKLTEAEVDAFVANNGFAASSSLATVATSGRFSDLSGVPSGLGDGDNDTLGALTCVDGQVAKRQGNTWVCGNDIDTKLTEAEVDAFVANNGFATSSSLATVASSGRFGDLAAIPNGLVDGDDDTLGALDCTLGHAPIRTALGWSCVNLTDSKRRIEVPTRCPGGVIGLDLGTGQVLMGNCAPPPCPEGTEDFGIKGGVISAGLFELDPRPFASRTISAMGYFERTCSSIGRQVIFRRCAWLSTSGNFGSCTPDTCPSGFIDLGVLTNQVDNIKIDQEFFAVFGSQERVCLLP
jgi:hypothetical protein